MMNKLAALLAVTTAAGCAAENDGALHLSGQLADAARVTHVVATNTSTGEQVVVDLKADGEPDGRFDIAVPSGEGAWVVTFADANKRGPAMRVATLQTGGIDAFSSATGGAIDFGTVQFSGRFAHGTVTWERLEQALGASRATLEQRGKLDNLALRYGSPDIDNDGEIDALQGHAYRLDISGTYRMQTAGRDAEIADLVKGMKSPTLRYTGTTIQAAVPRAMGMNMLSGTMQFDDPFFGTALGEDTPMVPAGTRIGYPHIKFGQLDGADMVGVVAAAERNAPSGTYRFGFDNGQLTFTDVVAPSAASLMAATDYTVPFVRIRPVQQGCVTDCDISSIDIEWMRTTTFGWERAEQPRDAHVELVAQLRGKRINLATELTNGATSQSWREMPVAGTGLVRSELAHILTSKLCYVAVSYTSELGMKMTGQASNPACF